MVGGYLSVCVSFRSNLKMISDGIELAKQQVRLTYFFLSMLK